MPGTCSLMVFTDLDGTLIDHETYTWEPARNALKILSERSCGVVLASSKTAAEITELRCDMGLEAWPAIVENGAGILPPQVTEISDATQYDQLLQILSDTPKTLRDHFRGFADMTVDEIVHATGLSQHGACFAKQRGFSEPGIWTGTLPEKEAFLEHLKSQGITAQQGGRFLTLSFGRNKVDQMKVLIDTYHPQHTLALGDAPNDIAMLEQADFGVVIANPAATSLPMLKGETEGKIIRTLKAGPEGWSEAILDLIGRLDIQKELLDG